MIRTSILAAVILAAASCAASASSTAWNIVWDDYYVSSPSQLVGTRPYATDDYDPHGVDSLWDQPMGAINVGSFVRHVQGENWSGATGWWNGDFRSPIAPGQSKTWDNIYLWVTTWWDPSEQPNVHLAFVQAGDPQLQPPPYWTYKLYLDYVPPELNYTGPWQWDISPTQRTYLLLPAYRSAVGTDGLRLHFTVEAVPEPSSLLALAGGLALLRFRKTRR